MVLYSAPRWKIRRLVQIALSAATCDTLVQYQEKEINRGLQLIEASDAELVARSLKQRLTEIERDEWRSKYDRQVLLTNDQRKKARRRTWSTIALGGITIFFGYLAAKQ